MNTKILLSFFAGMAFALAILLFVGLFTPYAAAQDGMRNADTTSDTGRASLFDLTNVFRRVRPEIQCQETAEFYDKLVAGYGLSGAADEASPQEGSNSVLVLPSITQIQHTALTLPFHEAGKNIKDEGLRDFYYRFLRDAGLILPPGE